MIVSDLYPTLFVERNSEPDTLTVKCHVCARGCLLREGQDGWCKVRTLRSGKVRLKTWGRIIAEGLDPIEKKPLRHYHPGSQVYTFASPGCTLGCRFCQNWELTSQMELIDLAEIPPRTPQEMAEVARTAGAQGLACSYTEPGAFLEFALPAMQAAHELGLFTVWHTNGYLSEQSAQLATRYLDAACIDLKAPDDVLFQHLTGGDLAPVLRCMEIFRQADVWLEVATPLLPGWNDQPDQVRRMAELVIRKAGSHTPWHLLRGHAAWQMSDLKMPSHSSMEAAADIARQTGLEFIYLGI